jgi:hypothetical protein
MRASLATLVYAIAATAMVTAAVTTAVAQQEIPDWVSNIRPDHPRLFFNADTWPGVMERALTVEREYYDLVKAHADTSEPRRGWSSDRYRNPDLIPMPETRPGSDLDPRDWGGAALSNALVYRIEPTPERLKRVRDMLWASLDYYHACYADNKEINWYGYSRLGWLAALDWVWNDLGPDERSELGRGILRHIDEVLHKPGIARRNNGTYTSGYYGGRNINLFIGLLLHNEGIDDEAAMACLLEGWGIYEKLLQHRSTMADDDGGAASPTITYSFGDYSEAEWNLIYALRSAAGADIPAQWPYIAMMPNYVMWNYIPPGLEFGFGDVLHVTNKFPQTSLYMDMTNIMNFYARSQPQWAALAATVREMLGGSYNYRSRGRIPYPLLLTDTDLAPDPMPFEQFHLPMARHFPAMGQVFMRSGTGPEDTYALFAAGGMTANHHHYDATHFTIYKQGFLSLDSGTRQGNSDSLQNYYAQTIAHNCILIKMPDEKPSPYWNGKVYLQSGGQDKRIGSKVIAFETGPHYSYVAGDATPVYNSDKCEMMVRQFLFLPPDHFVVFDRVTSTQADYAKTWLLHHANEPVLDGDTWYSDQDQGRIFCHTLLPADAAIEPVGGPGKEFLVEDVNYSITEGPAAWAGETGAYVAALDYEEVPELMGRWRVEVRPGAARTDDIFLHLIQVGDQSLQSMSDAQVDTGADGIVTLTFDASGRTVTLRLPTTGEVGGHIRITQGEQVLVDRPLTQQVMAQTGLAAAAE